MRSADKTSFVLLIKFRSSLTKDEVLKKMEERKDSFRVLRNLKQKYFLYEPSTEEIGGLYLWESEDSLEEYKKSELRASIAEAYKTIGEPRIEVFEVMTALN